MNKVADKMFLHRRQIFMSELHLRQTGFTYIACGRFTKHHERVKKLKESGNLNYIYKNELDKACFAHDAVYSDSQDLAKRTISDMILKNKANEIPMNRIYDEYKKGLASMVYTVFEKTGL